MLVLAFSSSGCRDQDDPSGGLARADPKTFEKLSHEGQLAAYLRSGECSVTLSKHEHLDRLATRYENGNSSDMEKLWSVTVVQNYSVEFVGVSGSLVEGTCKGRNVLEGYYERQR